MAQRDSMGIPTIGVGFSLVVKGFMSAIAQSFLAQRIFPPSQECISFLGSSPFPSRSQEGKGNDARWNFTIVWY